MAKNIRIIGYIGQYQVDYFFSQIDEILKDDENAEMILRVNTTGGEPAYAMSIIERVQETPEKFLFKGAGMMHSTGLLLAVYIPVENCECLDTTQAVLHRASYGEYVETAPWYPGSVHEQIVADSNKKLEKAFRARVDVKALEALPVMKSKNLTVKDIFSLDARHEVLLTGADLKKIGLVSKVNKVTPTESAKLQSEFEAFSKCTSVAEFKLAANAQATPPTPPANENSTENFNTMTLDELKRNHPALYAQVKQEGHAEGVTAEKDRVDEIMVYAEFDLAGAKAAIESGKPLTGKQRAEFSLKASSKATLEAIAGGGAANNGTGGAALGAEGAGADPKKTEAARLKATQEHINKKLGIKNPAIVVGE